MHVSSELMVQIQQKGAYGVGNPLPRSFLGGYKTYTKDLRKTALLFDFAQDCNDVLIMSKEPYICTKRLVYVQRDMYKKPIQKPCDSSWPRGLRSSYVNVQGDIYMCKET